MSRKKKARENLKQVAETSAPAEDSSVPVNGKSLFVFEYATKVFAVPLEHVERVIEIGSFEPYPGDAPYCIGTIEFHGRVLPLFDPHGLSYGINADGARVSYAVILKIDGVRFGLGLERYREFLESESWTEELQSECDNLGIDHDRKYLVGLLSYRNTTVALLSLQTIAAQALETFGVQAVLGLEPQESDGAVEVEGRKFMVSKLGDVTVAHPVEATIEIVEGLEVTPVFGVDPCLRGLTSLRGQVLACLDVSQALGMAPRVLDERSAYIVLYAENAEFALCVDSVQGLCVFASDAFQSAEGVLPPEIATLFPSLMEHGGVTHLCLSAESIANWQTLAPYRAQKSDASTHQKIG